MKRFYLVGFLVLMAFDTLAQISFKHAGAQALPARGTAVGPRHVGLRPGLVDEDQPRWVELGLRLEPGLAPPQHVWAVLLAGVRGLFLRVIRRRAKKRRSVP